MDVESMREKLLQLRQDLEEVSATGAAAADAVELDQSKVGRLSRMDALQAQAMAQATARRRAQTLVKIEQALLRITDGSYGECMHCGELINPKRLEVDPVAELCIACAE